MSRVRYPADCKIKAVRRVVEDGYRVCDVARDLGVSEGSLFFWVRRYRQLVRTPRPRIAPATGKAEQRMHDAGSLVAYLRRRASS